MPLNQTLPPKCPHEHMHECPLYRASHMPRGIGCMTGGDMANPCAVARGEMDYDEEMERLFSPGAAYGKLFGKG